MPKWRFTYWPTDYMAVVSAACERLQLPLYQIESVVREHQPEEVFTDPTPGTWRYYTDEFANKLGANYLDLAGRVLSEKPRWAGPAYGRERMLQHSRVGSMNGVPPAAVGTNLLGNLVDPETYFWGVTRGTIGGTMSLGSCVARKLCADATNDTHDLRELVHLDGATTSLSFSFIGRPEEYRSVTLWIGEHVRRSEVVYDLGGARVAATMDCLQWCMLDAGAVPLGDGWVWCYVSIACEAPQEITMLLALTNERGSIVFSGNPASGLWLGCFRLEEGPRATLDVASMCAAVGGGKLDPVNSAKSGGLEVLNSPAYGPH